MSETTSSDINAKQMSKKYKIQTYGFFAFSWLLGFALIFIIPEDIMTHTWAQQFVGWVGSIVPMVEGLEQIRLHGFSDPYKAHLTVFPSISFYYATLWICALLAVPYVMYLVKGNFIFNRDSNLAQLMVIKNITDNHQFKRKKYYTLLLIVISAFLYVYLYGEFSSKSWTKILFIYQITSGALSTIVTVGLIASVITFIYTHFLINKEE